MTPRQIAEVVRAVAAERKHRRSLANGGEDRGVIPAKVIVVDGHTALVRVHP